MTVSLSSLCESPLDPITHSPAALLPTLLSLLLLPRSSRANDLLSLFSSRHSISWSHSSLLGSSRFVTRVSSSSQAACLLACACGEGETAAATLGWSRWAAGLMCCLGPSVSSIIPVSLPGCSSSFSRLSHLSPWVGSLAF